jgi:rare lipoprotein A
VKAVAALAGTAGAAALLLLLAACAETAPRDKAQGTQTRSIPTSMLLRQPGGFYTDDGPDKAMPVDLEALPDARPSHERLHPTANEPYSVFGQQYVPLRSPGAYKRQGTASWYGRKYHGQRTVSSEVYDMYAMTAAHPTLPIPSYARITNLQNRRSVVVRINDRGPFHSGRIMDLSYAAAYKLGFVREALAQVEVVSVEPEGEPPGPQEVQPALAAMSLPMAAERSGVFLQLGAFSSRANAENFGEKIRRQLDWLNEDIGIVAGGGLYRLHLGPYRDRRSAGAMAEKIREALEFKPVMVLR